MRWMVLNHYLITLLVHLRYPFCSRTSVPRILVGLVFRAGSTQFLVPLAFNVSFRALRDRRRRRAELFGARRGGLSDSVREEFDLASSSDCVGDLDLVGVPVCGTCIPSACTMLSLHGPSPSRNSSGVSTFTSVSILSLTGAMRVIL
jgi:hypothetical protein